MINIHEKMSKMSIDIHWLLFGINTVDTWGEMVQHINLTSTLNDLAVEKKIIHSLVYLYFGV